jgi:hypothetical protein
MNSWLKNRHLKEEKEIASYQEPTCAREEYDTGKILEEVRL